MWTLVKTFLGGLGPRQVVVILVSLVLVSALSAGVVHYRGLKADLESTQQALRSETQKLVSCQVTVDSYVETTKSLEVARQEALAKAQQVSTRTRQLVTKTRSQPVDNTLESIQKRGLSTAPDAVDLWTR